MTTYRKAGVDQEAADALIPRYAELAAATRKGGSVDIGGFAGLLPLDAIADRGFARPALALSTDTTGTKIELLNAAGLHHTAGWDCVAMNVDDVVCCGAEPLVFVDCIATEHLDPAQATEIVRGVADACVKSGCELVGGETAQLPGLLAEGAYEVMGTCVGVVDLDAVWGPSRVAPGDAIVGLQASGLHSNGFSLVRKVLADTGDPHPDGLLEPTAIYCADLLALAADVEVHAAVHVTGGGIVQNLGRVLPDGAGGVVDPGRWPRPDLYDWFAAREVSEDEMRSTFNLGVGMLVLTPNPDDAVAKLADGGITAWTVGTIDQSGEASWA